MCRHYIGDEDCENNPSRGMASTNIQPMDISGSKSELSERWRVWLRGFTYFAEGKANLQNAARKRNELLYQAGSGVQDIFKNLTIITALEGQADDVYLQTVRTLNAYFRVQENAAYERHVLRQLRQQPGEDVDSFMLRLRKQARHCSYGPEELEFTVRDQLLEKISSLELWTKLFEEPNIQLVAAMEKARAWETARRQACNIAKGEGGQSKVNMVKDLDSKKPSSGLEPKSVMHVAKWDILLVVRYVQLGVKRAQSVVRKGTGQLVVRVLLRAQRVVEWKTGENVERSVLVMLNVILNQGTSKLIKLNMTVEMSLMHSLPTLMERGPVRIM